MSHPQPPIGSLLTDLQRDLDRALPGDPLQFCANWFAARLEEQRKILLLNSANANASSSTSPQSNTLPLSPTSASAPQHHTAKPPRSALKRPGAPSLGSGPAAGFSFGTSGAPTSPSALSPTRHTHGHLMTNPDMVPSPYSELPPGGSPFGPPPEPRIGGRNPGGPPVRPTGTGAGTAPLRLRSSSASRPGAGGVTGPASAPDSDSEMDDGSDQGSDDELDALPSQFPGRNGGAGGPGGGNGANLQIPRQANLGRRTSVSAESLPQPTAGAAPPLPKTVIPKTAGQRARIESSIKDNLLFRNLDEAQHADVLNAMKEIRLERGDEPITQGAVGDFFYVVEQGTFEVFKSDVASGGGMSDLLGPQPSTPTPAHERGPKVHQYGPGGSFGELALMYNAPRAATIVCSSPTGAILWALDRMTFRTIVMDHTFRKRKMYEAFLKDVPLLKDLHKHERAKIADALEERTFEAGLEVIREGERGKEFYFVVEGTAQVLKRDERGVETHVGDLKHGDYFGELALLNSAPRAATVRATPTTADHPGSRLRVACLGEKAFTRLLGPVREILQRDAANRYGPASSRPGSRAGPGGVSGGGLGWTDADSSGSHYSTSSAAGGTGGSSGGAAGTAAGPAAFGGFSFGSGTSQPGQYGFDQTRVAAGRGAGMVPPERA